MQRLPKSAGHNLQNRLLLRSRNNLLQSTSGPAACAVTRCSASSAPPGPLTPSTEQQPTILPTGEQQSGSRAACRRERRHAVARRFALRSFLSPSNSNTESMPRASGSSYQPSRQGQAVPDVACAVLPHAPGRAPRSLYLGSSSGQVSGQVVQANWQPATATRLVFINADRQGARKEVATDHMGRFRSRNWLQAVGWSTSKTPSASRSSRKRSTSGLTTRMSF